VKSQLGRRVRAILVLRPGGDQVEAIVGIGYLVGMIAMSIHLRSRAGLGQRRVHVFGPGGVGPIWLAKATVATVFWPVVLLFRLVRAVS
jgi:hypothetical protein